MKSNHIDNQRLFKAVTQDALLEEAEVEHLSVCDECLEMVRVFVRQNLSKSASP